MPKVDIYKTDGEKTGKQATLADAVFGVDINETVIHEAVVAHLANRRQGTQSALTRAEVRGGGIKPFRQKGTGRARQGSSRSPQYYHGVCTQTQRLSCENEQESQKTGHRFCTFHESPRSGNHCFG